MKTIGRMDHGSKDTVKDLGTLIVWMQNIKIYVGRCKNKINYILTKNPM